jgi:hypothetical protein
MSMLEGPRDGRADRSLEDYLRVIEPAYRVFHPPFSTGDWGDQAMFQNPLELASLCLFLQDKPIHKYLEVGAGRGVLMHFMREVMGYEVRGVEKEAWEPLAVNRAYIFRGDSRAPEVLARVDECAPYDLVFIDADHSYESARADLAAYRGYASRYVALHDIAYGLEPGVERLWQELPGEKTAFVDPDPVRRLGIGLLVL